MYIYKKKNKDLSRSDLIKVLGHTVVKSGPLVPVNCSLGREGLGGVTVSESF